MARGRVGTRLSVTRIEDVPLREVSGLAFTRNRRAIVALDTKKAKHNLLLLEPPMAAATAW
jgi:hypothetical protein